MVMNSVGGYMSKDEQVDRAIFQAVQANSIREQLELQEVLKGMGHAVPQATLSRRLKKLKIAKVEGVYKVVDLLPAFIPPVISVEAAEPNLLVLLTRPGYAGSLAEYIDQSVKPIEELGILGTIAGDDTVLLIVNGIKCLEATQKVLQEKLL